jgi:hypothetical protein
MRIRLRTIEYRRGQNCVCEDFTDLPDIMLSLSTWKLQVELLKRVNGNMRKF